jgi:tetratricopeptide (TPR) repeat protein
MCFALERSGGSITLRRFMNKTRSRIFAVAGLGLVLAFGCAPRKQVTDRDRTEAAHLASEAQFALSIREWARAEGLLEKAVQVAPTGDYWLSLGATRMRLNKRAGAKDAYQAALKDFANDSARHNTSPEPWVKQIYVLALLGRRDDSRAMAVKAAKLFPSDANIRAFTEPKEFEKMLSSQSFKDMAL